MMLYDYLPFVFFVLVACATYGLLKLFDPNRVRLRARVDELVAVSDTMPGFGAKTGTKPAVLHGAAELVEKTLPKFSNRATLQKRLMKAGFYNTSAVSWFVAVKIALMAVMSGFATIIAISTHIRLQNTVLYVFAAGATGFVLSGLWLERRINRRQLTLRRSLPDFLDLMIVCLEGGLSLQDTMRRVTEELKLVHPMLAYELGIVQRDIELGATVDQALKRFAVRTDYEGVRSLTTFIRESQRFGTNITDALRNHADMLRSQREQSAEENAQKAAVKILLPTLLLIFPATFVVLVGPAIIQIQKAFAKH
jgi:tight adherence protein C